jgi:hypothetical protein
MTYWQLLDFKGKFGTSNFRANFCLGKDSYAEMRANIHANLHLSVWKRFLCRNACKIAGKSAPISQEKGSNTDPKKANDFKDLAKIGQQC